MDKGLKIDSQFLLENALEKSLDMIETVILKSFCGPPSEKLQLVSHVLGMIRLKRGDIGINELSASTGCNKRNLERLFRDYVGLSPKKLCSLTRVHNFIREVGQETSAAKLTSAALTSGYFDQAHLNHEFKALTGITPSNYFRNSERLAVNFFAI